MPRPAPPMYGKVKRKVVRTATRRAAHLDPKEVAARELERQRELRKTPAQAAADQRAAEEEAKKEAKKTKRREAAAKKKAAPKKAKKKAAPKKAKKKAAKKKAAPKKKAAKKKAAPKKIKWSEDMTQKKLYVIAKKAGLKVLSKDWKSEIIRELKKADRKANK